MAVTVAITGGRQVENGFEIAYTINGRGGQGLVFANKQALADWVDDHALTEEDLLALLFRIWKARDQSLTLANITTHTLTADLTIANVLRLT